MIFTSPYPDVDIPDTSLPTFVLAGADALGNKPALIDGPTGRTLSYADLARSVRQVATSLARRGFQKGDVFAIYSPNVPEYAVALHAVATLGGIASTANHYRRHASSRFSSMTPERSTWSQSPNSSTTRSRRHARRP